MLQFQIETYAYYKNPPLPISLTIGWNRMLNNRMYMYAELREDGEYFYASEHDLTFYNSLADPDLGAPLEIYYLKILKRYRIYIPVEIYEAVQNYYVLDSYADIEELRPGIKAAVENCKPYIHDSFYSRLLRSLNAADLCSSQNLIIPIEDYSIFFRSYDVKEYYQQHKSVVFGIDYKKLEPNLVSATDSCPTTATYKPRLMLGEGNFSFTMALLKKHNKPHLGTFFVATEFMSEQETLAAYGAQLLQNIKYLRANGVQVTFGIDARNIHSYFKGQHFRCIHFNFPHDRSNYHDRTLPKLLEDFFQSAAQLQEIGDKIYIALPKPPQTEYRRFYEAYVYKIYEAAAKSGYRLSKKRNFGKDRYPEYQHSITGSSKSAKIADEAREYVFTRIELTDSKSLRIISYKSPTETKIAYNEKGCVLPEIDTDNDSTDDETYRR